MRDVGRFVLTVFSFSLVFALIGGLAFTALAPDAPWSYRTVTGTLSGALAGWAVWRGTAGGVPGLGSIMLKGAGLLGTLGFVGGFFGPMIFAPDANQGPMLGLFITGPGGVVLGAIGGAAWWALTRVRSGSTGA